MALLESNELYVWGYNAEGQLGLGNTVRSLIPIVNPNTESLSISKIFAGYLSASALITTDNKIYVWGYSAYGRLGFPASMNTPKELPTSINNEYNDIVFGDYHTLIGTKEGYIYGIGSNA
ncbi:Cell cycle control protein [Haploplasma axanthum]|uniref:Cell cycle control protein n=2 Tax=Haploplasma axanthum TaxID=29552 RepID=A0A449BCC6_HAPAX|nr:Cell cycle control protein [Haploplasma axanthum]